MTDHSTRGLALHRFMPTNVEVRTKFRNLKLYHFPATRKTRARRALHQTLGKNFEVETVQLYKGDQYREAYLQKNPNHNVPLLELALADGAVHSMLDSVARLAWLMDAFPEKLLSPPTGDTFFRWHAN